MRLIAENKRQENNHEAGAQFLIYTQQSTKMYVLQEVAMTNCMRIPTKQICIQTQNVL